MAKRDDLRGSAQANDLGDSPRTTQHRFPFFPGKLSYSREAKSANFNFLPFSGGESADRILHNLKNHWKEAFYFAMTRFS
jgi:hypothetical protein